MLEHKAFGVAELKATGPATGGAFEAIVAVFGNVDSGNDRIHKGAFVDTLKAPPEGRGYPPIVWSHLWGVAPIGSTSKAEEVEGYRTAKGDTVDGLFIGGDLFVDTHQTAAEVYTAMSRKGGDGLPVLRDFSFGYAARDFDFTDEDGAKIRELKRLDVYEVGPTLVGMNDAASLVDIKSLNRAGLEQLLVSLKAGARNSANDAAMLKEIHDLTNELGVACDGKALAATIGSKSIAAQLAARALEGKGYDDIDSYAVYLLSSMIEYGASYISSSSDEGRVARMRALLLEAAALLGDAVSSDNSGDAAKAIADHALTLIPTSGTKDDPTPTPSTVDPDRARELLLAFPS